MNEATPRVRCSCAVIVAIVVAWLTPNARANVIIEWNDITLNLIREKSMTPPEATRVLAMVHVAMYDAVNAHWEEYEAYLISPLHKPPYSSRKVAAAAAAHKVLVKVFPEYKAELHEALEDRIDQCWHAQAGKYGKSWGRLCGKRVWEYRKHDGAKQAVNYIPSGVVGFWQPTPAAFAPALLPQWGGVETWAMDWSADFRAPAPPALGSREFAQAYLEVKSLGKADSASRTADQTEIAYFWEDGPGTVTPPGHWHVIAQDVAKEKNLGLVDTARLFALLAIAQADAAISAWDSKYYWDFVRPVTSIQFEGAVDNNDATIVDPEWMPLLPTPPFPSYTSGHSTFSGVSSRILERFVGTDEYHFKMTSPDPNRWPDVLPGVTREWLSFSEAAEEAGASRIYGGIHFQFDNTAGLEAGRALADHVFDNFMLPN